MINMLPRFAQPLAIAALVLAAGIAPPAQAAPLDIAQMPLYLASVDAAPPLNMLVMGRDHKLYYEAYNDASDLNGDGILDVGYKPTQIDYYGYFNSHRCYSYSTTSKQFSPGAAAPNKTCSNAWSGDFLNYLTTSRMDAMRKVLYGGYRVTDTASSTVLERSYIPQDAHSWGKEYTSTAFDGYNIAQYAPLGQPESGRRHLFANTTLRNSEDLGPLLRVLSNSRFRIWNWVSRENPVAGSDCIGSCTADGTRPAHPGHPQSKAAFDTLETTFAIADYRYGGVYSNTFIDCRHPTNNSACNLGDAEQNDYMTIVTGSITILQAGNYQFRVDGDDNIDFHLYDSSGALVASAGCYPNGRGFGACSGAEIATAAELAGTNPAKNNLLPGTYTFKFRMEEASGDDGYKLEWQRRSWKAGTRTVPGVWETNTPGMFPWRVLRTSLTDLGLVGNLVDIAYAVNATAAGGFSGLPEFRFYNLRPGTGISKMTDHRVRVEACVSGSLEPNCKRYPDGNYKPTGILHDYGEEDKMFFGLLTGSYEKNTDGGVLRRNLGSFASEINASNGTFKTDVVGIVKTIDRQRVIEFKTNYQYECGWIANRAITAGECSMWGNPVGEMMYETLRYFAGAGEPRPEFAISDTSKDSKAPLLLPQPKWVSPYDTIENKGAGYLSCASPVMTVISDINPSYDGGLPGSHWGAISGTSDPVSVRSLDVSKEVDAIWSAEGGGSRKVFIGESNNTADSAPTEKTVSNLSTVRGLAPEEPSKEGTYYSAGVARFGANNPIGGDKKALTYAIALASPLPTLKFPVDGKVITVVPFAKSVGGGYSIDPAATFQPTNQIVDFYVQKIANTDPAGSDADATVNGGRPYAEFRVNYEDVEQGADHDMDAIALYVLEVTDQKKLKISLNSEYASGGIIQYLGYVISGTQKDGIYLEVSDCDTASRYANNSFCSLGGTDNGGVSYKFNTPPGQDSGYCAIAANLATKECQSLPYTASRSFEPGTTVGAGLLKDPLWYAAKYGRSADITWDSDGDKEPDNYFLVTNAGTLKEQLDRAFSQIINDTRSSGGVAASGTRREAGFLAYVPEYNSSDWTGDLRAHGIIRNEGGANDGDLQTPAFWTAKAKLGTREASDRKIFYVDRGTTTSTLKPFASGASGLGANDTAIAAKLGVAATYPASIHSTVTFDHVINHIRGDAAQELKNGGRLRDRSGKLGDILGSQPTVLTSASFGYGGLDGGGAGTLGASYQTFIRDVKSKRDPVVFVGANDGMLHAFNATTGAKGGEEIFAMVPNSVLPFVHKLVEPAYQHRYFVDGSPVQGDAYIGGAWKTVILAPTGAGGRSVVALDATNPAATGYNPSTSLLWEFQDADLGYTIGQPSITVLQDGRWVALIPNGYNSNSQKAFLFVVDLATGALLHKIALGTGGSTASPNGAGSVLAVDIGPANTGADSKADVIYASDYFGNVWRMAVGTGSIATPTLLFKAVDGATTPKDQIITGGLGAAFHHVSGQMVFFGTGRYMLNGDNKVGTAPQRQTFYGVWDNNDGTAVTRAKLQKQAFGSSPSVIDWSAQKGWMIDLPESGERFIGLPEVSTGRVIFTTFVPVGDPCTPGGKNFLNVVNITSGTGGLAGPPPTDAIPNPPPGGREELPQGGGGPVPSPPVVATPPAPDCDPTKPGCRPEPPCEEANPLDCKPPTRPAAKECKTDLGILLSDGIQNFDSVTCGRQSWRQIR